MFITPFKTEAALENMEGDDVVMPPVEDVELAPYVEEEPLVEDMPDESMITVDDELPPDDEVMSELDEEVQGSESLLMEIEHLSNLATAIEAYGISPGMMFVADRDGLLASTFISIPATESMAGAYRPESQTSVAALEGVMDAIKSKTAEWAAKAGAAVKSMVAKAGGMISSAVSAVTSLSKKIASKAWDATKAAEKTIKAHPYKTAAVLIGTIAAAASVMGLIWALPAEAAAVGAWFNRIKTALAGIKAPGGQVAITMEGTILEAKWVSTAADGTKMFSTTAEKVGVLGWTKNAAAATATGLKNGLMKIAGFLKTHADTMITGVAFTHEAAANYASAKAAKKTYGEKRADGHGKVMSFLHAQKAGFVSYVKVKFFVLRLTWLLLKNVVMGSYKAVKQTLTEVVDTVLGRTPAAT